MKIVSSAPSNCSGITLSNTLNTLSWAISKLPTLSESSCIPISAQKKIKESWKTIAITMAVGVVLYKIMTCSKPSSPGGSYGFDEVDPASDLDRVDSEFDLSEVSASPQISFENFIRLDRTFVDLRVIAKQITTQPDHKFYFKKPSQEKLREVEALEDTLKKRYNDDFSFPGWHGNQSYQRLLFQDPQFIAILQSEELVKTLLWRRAHDQEKPMGAANLKLSNVLLYGLASNAPSFLTTATPNLLTFPKLDQGKWREAISQLLDDENPRVPDSNYLQNFERALDTVQSVLFSSSPNVDPDLRKKLLKLDELDTQNLIKIIRERKTEFQELGVRLWAKGSEAFCFLSEAKTLFNMADKNYSAVLGYGAISHGLDYHHLAGALCGEIILDSYQKPQKDGRKFLTWLLNLPPENPASDLMKARLKQVVLQLILAGKLNLN